jgi:hypothetical protein
VRSREQTVDAWRLPQVACREVYAAKANGPEIQRAALRAAAKVVFSASALACGSSGADPETRAPKADPVASCEALVASAYPQAGPRHDPNASPEVVRCCQFLADNAERTSHSTYWTHRETCCWTVLDSIKGSCTPWGPPVPPPMPRASA